MNLPKPLSYFFEKAVQEERFIRLILSKPTNQNTDYQKIRFDLVKIKGDDKIKCVYTTKTQEFTHNYAWKEASEIIQRYTDCQFKNAVLFCTNEDLHWFLNKKMKSHIKSLKPSLNLTPIQQHDKAKKRWLETDKAPYLVDLKVCNSNGQIAPKMGKKFKQIDKYIDTLNGIIGHSAIQDQKHLTVLDMGSGKGYLTFALYDYIKHHLNKDCTVIGVERRQDLVDLCNKIAQKHQMQGLSFVTGTIADYQVEKVDILIALHACDTATDDAIYKGITSNAEIIVTAPCCHKQVRQCLNVTNELREITRFGILQERQAEILTDSIRALVLESKGYKSQVFEFIADAHTHKNVMVVGVKKQKHSDASVYLKKIDELKQLFGLTYQQLERMLYPNNPSSR